jgi:hypothetical protein
MAAPELETFAQVKATAHEQLQAFLIQYSQTPDYKTLGLTLLEQVNQAEEEVKKTKEKKGVILISMKLGFTSIQTVPGG